jgi:hypothetical protein
MTMIGKVKQSYTIEPVVNPIAAVRREPAPKQPLAPKPPAPTPTGTSRG